MHSRVGNEDRYIYRCTEFCGGLPPDSKMDELAILDGAKVYKDMFKSVEKRSTKEAMAFIGGSVDSVSLPEINLKPITGGKNFEECKKNAIKSEQLFASRCSAIESKSVDD